MVPDKQDVRWRYFVTGSEQFELSNLAVKMLLMRGRIMTAKRDEKVISDAIGIAHEFFRKNSDICQADLQSIFK